MPKMCSPTTFFKCEIGLKNWGPPCNHSLYPLSLSLTLSGLLLSSRSPGLTESATRQTVLKSFIQMKKWPHWCSLTMPSPLIG